MLTVIRVFTVSIRLDIFNDLKRLEFSAPKMFSDI